MPFSDLDYYRIVRGQIEHEDNLVNQRLSWFIASQSFLFTAFAILLNSPGILGSAAMDIRALVLRMIPLLAVCVALIIYLTIFAAMYATARLRRLMESYCGKETIDLLPQVQGYRQSIVLGQGGQLLLPLAFLIAWVILALRSWG